MRCILFHIKLEHLYHPIILALQLWESALKLYIKEMVLLKPLLLGATLARAAVQSNSLAEWLISQRLTCYHRYVYTRQEHKATELYKYFIRLNVR